MSLSIAWTAFALSWLPMVPVLAGAQSTIAGEARDATGAVLPGVTVEAASDALIERSAPPRPAGRAHLGLGYPRGWTVESILEVQHQLFPRVSVTGGWVRSDDLRYSR